MALENGRAKFAFECIENGKRIVSKPDELKSHIGNTPMLIKNNGLGATLGFYLSKKKKKDQKTDYEFIGECFLGWIKDNDILPNQFKNFPDDFEKFVKKITELPPSEYRLLSSEALKFFTWMKRFSEGMIL